MKTLYLHIGTPKTATSSLQKFLEMNQEVLRSNNFSYYISPYPKSQKSRRRNANFLTGPELNESVTEERRIQDQNHLDSGLDWIKNQFSTCDNVIMTDEHLWKMFNYSQWDPLQILLEHAKKNNYQIKVIVYLRRQDKFEISRWNQFIKNGSCSKSLGSLIRRDLKKFPLILHYDQALDKIAEGIGKENVLVRRYEPSCWTEGSIYMDFQKALNLPDNIPMVYPEKEINLSLKNNFIEFMRRLNENKFLSDSQKDLLANCIRHASDKQKKNDDYGFMTADETKKFLSLFEKGNEYVAKEYIGDGRPLYFGEIKEVKKWTQNNPYMMEDFSVLLADISTMMLKKREEEKKVKEYEKNLTSVRFCFKQTLVCLQRKIFAV